MTTATPARPAVRTHAEAISALKKIAICLRIPKSLVTLLVTVLALLPDELCKAFPNTLLLSIPRAADLSRIDRQLLMWLLADPVFGLQQLAKHTETSHAITITIEILSCQANGIPPTERKNLAAKFIAERAQARAWDAHQLSDSRTPSTRIEWMTASAVLSILDSHPSSVTNAVLDAAVAWSAEINGAAAMSMQSFYRAIHDKLLALFAQATTAIPLAVVAAMESQACAGDHVTFDDPDNGPQKGVVARVVTAATIPFALIEISDQQDGSPWQIPLSQLQVEARAA